jgi:hypothetical protein
MPALTCADRRDRRPYGEFAMKHLRRLALAAALAVALPVAFCRPAPDTGPPAGRPSELLLDGWPEVVTLRAAAYEQIARDVADGQRSLFQAAGLFRALNRLPPTVDHPPADAPHLTIPTDTEAGWLCRQVVVWVPAALHAEPDRAAAVVARMTAAFFAELRAHGTVRLPDPASLEPVPELLEQARARRAEARRADQLPRRAAHDSLR